MLAYLSDFASRPAAARRYLALAELTRLEMALSYERAWQGYIFGLTMPQLGAPQ